MSSWLTPPGRTWADGTPAHRVAHALLVLDLMEEAAPWMEGNLAPGDGDGVEALVHQALSFSWLCCRFKWMQTPTSEEEVSLLPVTSR